MAPPPSHSQAVLPSPKTLVLERIERTDREFRIFVHSRQSAGCPGCGRISRSRHSAYARRLGDVPWQGLSVQIILTAHRYRCRNRCCPRKIFCQRIPGVARAYARQTTRLEDIVVIVGYVAGGLPGARLLARLAIETSDDTVRRRLLRFTSPSDHLIRHLGVDDWAWRKHHSYGTILVDLDRHLVADLLPDRCSESLAFWLTRQPGIELITRDRFGVYAEGAAQGAPSAVQVADRFHLVLNLSAAIERTQEERRAELVVSPAQSSIQESPRQQAEPKPTLQQELQQQRRQRRLERYQSAAKLFAQGRSKRAIAEELNLSYKTVRRWLRAGQFPERKPPSGRRQHVAEFSDYLRRRWDEGCHNGTQLCREIRTQGYKGSRQMVTNFVARWRPNRTRDSRSAPQNIDPKTAAILAMRSTEQMTEEQQVLLDRVSANCPDLIHLRAVAVGFREALSAKSGPQLHRWIATVKRSGFGPLIRFGYGLQRDISAVTAAIETAWSNGQVEGQINRLKAIKRQMYGRAGFRFLRARVLPPPATRSP